MRLLPFVTLAVLAAAALGPDGLSAQRVASMTEAALPLPILEQPSPRAVSQLAESQPDQAASEGWGGRFLTGVGGALIGAGLGYFASQVVVGDWDDPGANRTAWLAGGAGVGLVLGWKIGPQPGAPGRGLTPTGPRDLITADEIEASAARTAYEAVDLLRPEWFVLRGTASWRETARGSGGGTGAAASASISQEGITTIPVYVDGAPVGGTEELRQISAADVSTISRLTPAQATNVFGMGHAHGAIVVETR